MMVKQCKGRDIQDIPKSKLDTQSKYFGSIKYDGNYVQICKMDDSVRFFTSGGKEFYHSLVSKYLQQILPEDSFILECEFTADTEGMLGDRRSAAKLTTYRTNFMKSKVNRDEYGDKFRIFDVVLTNTPFYERLHWLRVNFDEDFELIAPVEFELNSLDYFIDKAKKLVRQGYEGMFLKKYDHLYIPGKRVNEALKLKYRKTIELTCIGIEPGTGKYTGQIGSLLLQDDEGRLVYVGSGLDDQDRGLDFEYFVGKQVEIAYEQCMDTYIQPTFVRVRDEE